MGATQPLMAAMTINLAEEENAEAGGCTCMQQRASLKHYQLNSIFNKFSGPIRLIVIFKYVVSSPVSGLHPLDESVCFQMDVTCCPV